MKGSLSSAMQREEQARAGDSACLYRPPSFCRPPGVCHGNPRCGAVPRCGEVSALWRGFRAVARSPDLATGPTEGLRRFEGGDLRSAEWHGRETMPQLVEGAKSELVPLGYHPRPEPLPPLTAYTAARS